MQREAEVLFKFVLVAIGGGAGACLRYLLAIVATQLLHVSVLYATFSANLLGCFFIGLLWGLGSSRWQLSEHAILLFATGFLGGLTTFSTFQLELFNASQQRQYLTLFVYFSLSLIIGFGAVCLGAELGKAISTADSNLSQEQPQAVRDVSGNNSKNDA